jgi:small subunit ribosomal protein S1
MTDQTTPENRPAPDAPDAQSEATSAEPTVGEALSIAPSYEVVNTEAVSAEPAPTAEAVTEPAPAAEPSVVPAAEPDPEPQENFGDLLAQFEKSHKHRTEAGPTLQGTVVSLTADQVLLDVGYKIEGALPRSAFPDNADTVNPGDSFPVSITGRTEEGYYQLSRFKISVPKDWAALESAFTQKLSIAATVTAVVKGGVSVDVGVRAFMPASRSGTRDAAELEALVGQEITVRITKLDVADENVVVDRRAVLEEQALAAAQARHAGLKEGDVVPGTVRSLTSYGAFVDLGGIDGLLHVSDIAWSRIAKPEDVLSVGQALDVKILKIDPDTKKLSLGLKQLQTEPWQTVPARFTAGQRVGGVVTRVMDFGAFVEIEPGVEGLIHVSEMSWGRKVRIASDILKPGERVDAVILNIKPEERRISLGLKQNLTDPWTEVASKFPVGSQVQGPVTKLMPFGAFVQIAEGVEGMVHIGEIVADRRLHHPSEALREGQVVQAQVLAIDPGKRQIRLSMKQLIPTSIDEYIAEHKAGDKVSGRVVEQSGPVVFVELGEGIRATCRVAPAAVAPASRPAASGSSSKVDLSNLSSMLKDRWKGNAPAAESRCDSVSEGQIRSFTILKLDSTSKTIELELA